MAVSAVLLDSEKFECKGPTGRPGACSNATFLAAIDDKHNQM